MSEVKRRYLPLAKIKANQQNPRIISESKLKKLINSLLVFPKMMSLRPITLDDNNCVLGGNMRQTALGRIAQMTFEELSAHMETLPEFKELPNGGEQVLKFWENFLNKPQAEVQYASELTESEKKQFIIKDNVSFGDWDYDELEHWDTAQLEDWGVDMMLPDFNEGIGDLSDESAEKQREIKETEKLSDVKFYDVYYTPKEKPDLNLRECVNLELFEKKLQVINESPLSDEQKEVMRLLAYRFIKIDFESVANYYAFNASEDEKRVIERLRCVLVDGAIDGFIEDRMLQVYEHFDGATQKESEDDEDD